jgi:hypothetical protein
MLKCVKAFIKKRFENSFSTKVEVY